MLPVLGRKVVEGEQHVAVLGQAGHRLVVLGAVGLQEEVEGLPGAALVVPYANTEAMNLHLQEISRTVAPGADAALGAAALGARGAWLARRAFSTSLASTAASIGRR